MADLGSIGDNYGPVYTNPRVMRAGLFRGVNLPGVEFLVLGGKSITEGDPAQPSLYMSAAGRWRFRWALGAVGANTISVNVKQPVNATPRPTLVVRANPEIGINANVTGTAGAGAGWVTIGPITVNSSALGAVWVELWNNYDAQTSPCWWDKIVTSP